MEFRIPLYPMLYRKGHAEALRSGCALFAGPRRDLCGGARATHVHRKGLKIFSEKTSCYHLITFTKSLFFEMLPPILPLAE